MAKDPAEIVTAAAVPGEGSVLGGVLEMGRVACHATGSIGFVWGSFLHPGRSCWPFGGGADANCRPMTTIKAHLEPGTPDEFPFYASVFSSPISES